MIQRTYHDGYANLAAAIIADGHKHNDQVFLNSDWCDTLRWMCKLDDELHVHDDIVRIPKGSMHGIKNEKD